METIKLYKNAVKRIGILGGSFNPPHLGHLDISKTALEALQVDEIWWVVTPQNPLKGYDETAPIDVRIRKATALVGTLPIVIKDVESDLGSHYTYDVLNHLSTAHTDIDFIWLMGADSFATFDQWHRWNEIGNIMPFAIFNRPDYKDNALQGKASCAMKASRTNSVNDLFSGNSPKWIYIDTTQYPQSATDIRKNYTGDWWKQ